MTEQDVDATASRRLRLEEFFAGDTRLWGVFRDRFGTVRRQFTITANGTWDGSTLTLTEFIEYDDGEEERRVWRIKKVGDSRYEGHTDGVAGTAMGDVDGNTFRWRYTFALPFKNRSINLTFDDCMYLQGDGVMINCVTVRKFGLRVGEIMGTFVKGPIPSSHPEQSPG